MLVQPFEEVPPRLLDVGLVSRGAVFSLPVYKAVSLPRKRLNLVIHYAVFFKLLDQCGNLIWGGGVDI